MVVGVDVDVVGGWVDGVSGEKEVRAVRWERESWLGKEKAGWVRVR